MKIVFALCCGIIISAMGDQIKDSSVKGHTLKISIPEGWEESSCQVADIVAKGRLYGGVDPNNQIILLTPSKTNQLLRNSKTLISMALSAMSNDVISESEFEMVKNNFLESSKSVYTSMFSVKQYSSIEPETENIYDNWVHTSFYINHVVYGRLFLGSGLIFLKGSIYVFHFSIVEPRPGEVFYLKQSVSKWLNSLCQLNKLTVLPQKEKCKLEFLQGPERISETKNESASAVKENKKNKDARLHEVVRLCNLDKEFLDYTTHELDGDPEAHFKWLDDWSERRFGIRGLKGRVWLKDRREFSNPNAYVEALTSILARGYEAIATPEYKAWMDAEKSGNREEKIRVASKYHRELKSKTKDEIDFELGQFDVKVKSQNFYAYFLALAHDFTQEEKNIVYAALCCEDGIPYSCFNQYKKNIQTNKDKGDRAFYLINHSRCGSCDSFERDCNESMLMWVYADIKRVFLKWFDR
jgi:hypothetical protein